MKHNFRFIIGMLALAIPLCVNAQDNKELNDLKDKVDRMPKISGFVQGMYQANLNADGELIENTFRMRRVRMSIDGALFKGLTYKIQGDFVNSPFLVDAYLKYKVCNEFAIQAGQFKLPFSIENPINPLNLEIFDYGEVIQHLVGYNDVCGVGALGRDIGIMASGSLFPVETRNGQKFGIVDYSIGVFNGNGPVNFKKNEKGLDNNNRKDIVGRLDIHPWVKALTISGSYYYGLYRNTTVEDQIESNGIAVGKTAFPNGIRNRWAAGVQYNDGKLVLRGEYISGKTGCKIGGLDEYGEPIILDNIQYSKGYYAVAGYFFKFGKEGMEQKLMPVLRYEHYEPGYWYEVYGHTDYYTVGINYWPLKSVNFKLDYSLIRDTENAIDHAINSHRIVALLSYKF